MRLAPIVLATTAVLGVLTGCSGSGSDQSSPSPAASSVPASAPASPSSSTGGSASTPASGSPSATGGKQVNTAGDALTFTMPCAQPRDQKIEGNAEDAKTYTGFHAWACSTGTDTTAGVIVAELRKTPADDDAARRALTTALGQIVKGTPTDNDFQGHPGLTQTVDSNGATAGYQGVSFGPYLALFFTAPADDLGTLTSTVKISS